VFIGHLPYKAHESDVEKFFSRYGRIREILMKNGFGFVEFDDPRDAEEAVYKCNGKELRGERVIVEMTKRPPKGRDMYGRGDRGGGGRGGYGGDRGYGGRPNYNNRGSPPRRRENDRPPSQTKYRVIVENLSSRVSWQDLKDVMRAAGEVTYADAHRIRQNEGIVCFSCAADLKKALDTLDGKEMNGRKIKLIDASRDSRRSRSKSKSRSRSGSRSRSRSSRRRSRSGSASSKSKSRSRSRSSEKSRSKSGSRSRSGSATAKKPTKDKLDSKKRSRTKSREKSHSRSASPDDKRRAGSRSASPDDKGRKSDVDD